MNSGEEFFIRKIKGNEKWVRQRLIHWIKEQRPESKIKEKVRKSPFAPDMDVLEFTKERKLIAYEVKTVSARESKSPGIKIGSGAFDSLHIPNLGPVYTGLGQALFNLLQFTDEVYLVYPDVVELSERLETLGGWFPLPFGLIKFFLSEDESKQLDFEIVIDSPYNPLLSYFEKDKMPEEIEKIRSELVELFEY